MLKFKVFTIICEDFFIYYYIIRCNVYNLDIYYKLNNLDK